MQLCYIKMKVKNLNKNNELVALVEVLKEKGLVSENEIKAKKEKFKNDKKEIKK